ncbi:hypothetical protein CAPTEDRAFT_221986, partial [Capitella teleta]
MADCSMSVHEIEADLKKILLNDKLNHKKNPVNCETLESADAAQKQPRQRKKSKTDRAAEKGYNALTAAVPSPKKTAVNGKKIGKKAEDETGETEVKSRKKRRPNRKERLRMKAEQEGEQTVLAPNYVAPPLPQPVPLQSPLNTAEASKIHPGRPEKSQPKPALLPTPLAAAPRPKKDHQKKSPDDQAYQKMCSDLERDFLFPLKKKSYKFPSAKFFCRLCEYHCDDMKKTEILLRGLPLPSKPHIAAIEEMLQQVMRESTASEDDLRLRHEAYDQVVKAINAKIPEAQLVLYGSSYTGIALRTSDVNIDITMENSPKILKKIYDFLRTDDSGCFCDVRSDFSAKVPSVLFTMPAYGQTTFQIAINNSPSCKTSKLLQTFVSIDPRVGQLSKCFRWWAHLCSIDSQDNGSLPAYAFAMMTVYFLQQCQPPVLPVLHELVNVDPKTPGSEHEYLDDSDKLKECWASKNTSSLAELWLQLLRFYCVDFDMGTYVICVRQKRPLPRSEKKWASKRIALEGAYTKLQQHPLSFIFSLDPFIRRRNIARTLSHSQIFEYIVDRLRAAYMYFGIPQTKSGPLFGDVDANELDRHLQLTMQCKGDEYSDVPSVVPSTTENVSSKAAVAGTELQFIEQFVNGLVDSVFSHQSMESSKQPSELFDLRLLETLSLGDMQFNFSAPQVVDGKGPAVFCSICQRSGHLKQNCPDENLPPPLPVPPMTTEFRIMLDNMLWMVPNDFEPSERETFLRKTVLHEMEEYVRETFPDAQLSLFGSSVNGFGFKQSDLDICLQFKSTPVKDSQSLNCVAIIETLAQILKIHRGFYNVFAITTAKVPIVKFRHRRSQLEGDISLYNTLAQHNTRLLQAYSEIDSRVRVLGYTMKVFAKCCDICDASRGSLSSYAFVLMVIYYLQQCDPPVLPVLQELYTGKKPEVLVDGWNAWFLPDIKNLRQKWSHYGCNNASVSELWNGLLRFYTEEFNMRDYVISIRQKEPLTKFEKLWNSKCISIEDPFDLDHNLGSGLSRKMNIFIIKALRNARQLYGTPFEHLPPHYKTMQAFLFDADLLTDGAPPNDRGCRICGRIGHFMRDCPVVMAKKEGKGREKNHHSEGHDDNVNDRNTSHADTFPGVSQPISIPQAGPRSRPFRRSFSLGHTPPSSMEDSYGSQTSSPGVYLHQHQHHQVFFSPPPASTAPQFQFQHANDGSSPVYVAPAVSSNSFPFYYVPNNYILPQRSFQQGCSPSNIHLPPFFVPPPHKPTASVSVSDCHDAE